jgi:hypothetical protein
MGMMRNPRGAGVSILMPLLLAACASAPKNPPAPAPAATPAAPLLDASYDWHGLLLLPFGSVLKDAPFTLHEVLMFRDAAHAAQGEDAECYAMERAAPPFLKRTPSEYLLCFKHDHLARVEATVNLPPEEAAQIFSDACGLWQRNSGRGQTAVAPAAAGAAASGEAAGAQVAANSAAATSPVGSSACEGRDGVTSYSSRLEENSERSDRALSIRLDATEQP